MTFDRLLTAQQVADLLGASIKSVRRWSADRQPGRIFPEPVSLPSPSGSKPMLRWRESEILRFGGLIEA
jgi:predicted DNA-binding transcriptional regulator AlpA